jgi:ATP synthase, F0 subunit b
MGIIEKRQNEITGRLNDADNIKAEAFELKSNYEKDIKNANAEAAAIIKEARERAELEYNKKLEEAKVDAAGLIAEANKLIELEKKKAMESAQAEIAGIAMLAAAKVIGKNVDNSTNQQLLGDFLKEVGAAK